MLGNGSCSEHDAVESSIPPRTIRAAAVSNTPIAQIRAGRKGHARGTSGPVPRTSINGGRRQHHDVCPTAANRHGRRGRPRDGHGVGQPCRWRDGDAGHGRRHHSCRRSRRRHRRARPLAAWSPTANDDGRFVFRDVPAGNVHAHVDVRRTLARCVWAAAARRAIAADHDRRWRARDQSRDSDVAPWHHLRKCSRRSRGTGTRPRRQVLRRMLNNNGRFELTFAVRRR